MTGLVAMAETQIEAPPDRVWQALTDPVEIKQYMFGSDVQTDWRPGSAIVWKGEYQGRTYEDHGTVLEVEPARRLTVTHFSPMTGQPDVPENYHTITYELDSRGGGTHVSLHQDNNRSTEEQRHSADNWQMTLGGLKRLIEGG